MNVIGHFIVFRFRDGIRIFIRFESRKLVEGSNFGGIRL